VRCVQEKREARAFFEPLSFTKRKEYVVWVVGAQQQVTRYARTMGAVQKLLIGLKNPSGRNG
jgi:uncharacterized protein YdeI (YjbR/CyaY-like superfamily)